MKKLLMLSVAIATITVAAVSMAELPLPGPQPEGQPQQAQAACVMNCMSTKQSLELMECITECGVETEGSKGFFNPLMP